MIICLKNCFVYLKNKSCNGNDKLEKINFQKINALNSKIIIKYDCKYYYTILQKSIKYLFVILIFAVIYLFYFLSLEKCNEGLEKCSLKLSWIESIIKKEFFSCVLLELMLQLMFLNIISKKNSIHIVIILIIFFLYSHGLKFSDHGYYNFFFYIVLLFIFTLIFIPIDFCIICCKNKLNSARLIIIYILLLLLFYVFLSSSRKNCDDWPKGLNNSYIENDKSKFGCQIQIPKLCLYKSLEYIQDFSRLMGKNCKNLNNGNEERKIILELSNSPYINKNKTIKHIGYPLLNKYQKSLSDFSNYEKRLTNFFLNNIVDMDNETILNKYYKEKMPEVEIDFTNIKEPKLVINLHFNKTLSKERQLLEKNAEPYSDNVLILYIDSLSRVNALRQLKKTTKFFEQFMPYKGRFHKKYSSENYHSFQFFKYYSFIGWTTGNYPILFYGQNFKRRKKSIITKFFKKNGFITSEAIDFCGIDNIRAFHNFNKEDIYDHILSLCDPNNDYYSLNTIRCLYGKQNIEHLIEYTNQFWKKYRNNRKYSLIISNYAHEGTLTVVKYLDNIISEFLNNLFNHNLLKNTIVLLLSDHGTGMPSIYYSTDFYEIERNLPILLILVNDRKNISYEEQYKHLYENQQNYITAFDIFNTLGNIIYGDKYKTIKSISKNKNICKSPYGISLFNKINSKQRYPKKYKHLGPRGMSTTSCK